MIRALVAVTVLGLLPISLEGQQIERSELASFFEALTSELPDQEVFAIDARSFSALLEDSLGWSVAPEEVEDLIGDDFRYGGLALFQACELGDCRMARPGTHVALGDVSASRGSQQISIRLHLTGGVDQAPTKRTRTMVLQRSPEGWRVSPAPDPPDSR